jgi:predicted aspartyl protease
LAKVIGSVDELGRPVVRIEVPDREGFLAVVDTGFNRSLLLLISEAQAMGFVVTEDAEIVELGTAVKTKVLRASGMVRWLDRTIQVEALVSDEPMPVSGRDTARALVGTELLANCRLLVDFVARGMEIEEQRS